MLQQIILPIMADPLLSSLCRVCNTNSPKYRCPRCSSQTCSLACSKRHKLWSDCNGVRDPTVYKPRRELATPAGIDHDYNFISAIERGIERTDKVIVEERGLLDRKELLGRDNNGRWNGRKRGGADTALSKALERSGVIVDRAPKGMKRNMENSTNWSKSQKCINWQIEWIQEDGTRVLGKVLEKQPIGQAHAHLLEEQRRANMTEAERKQDKKRKSEEMKMKEAKRARLNSCHDLFTQRSILQNPASSAWDLLPDQHDKESNAPTIAVHAETTLDLSSSSTTSAPPPSRPFQYFFYLHKPHTPSSPPHPRVLIPLHPSDTFQSQLRNRVLLEFPTVHVLSFPPAYLPDIFMLEEEFLAGRDLRRFVLDGGDEGEDEDMDMEEGEVV
jgi:HIT zinc finger